jgi:hypothetical protein
VQNHLKVRPQPPVPDEQIEIRVGSALARDPFVDRYQIEVAVRDGSVLLAGTVGSSFEKSHAEGVAAGIKGVADVRNHLHVAHAPIRVSDLERQRAAAEADSTNGVDNDLRVQDRSDQRPCERFNSGREQRPHLPRRVWDP